MVSVTAIVRLPAKSSGLHCELISPFGFDLPLTKALWASDYRHIAANWASFGDFDPFGDFDLLFGAAKLNLKIMEVPVRYGARTYGATNIPRWRHGFILMRMVLFASRKIKFR